MMPQSTGRRAYLTLLRGLGFTLVLLIFSVPAGVGSDSPPVAGLSLISATRDVQADQVWTLPDAEGHALTGRGVTVCDVDGGLDIFHPMFFRADGGVFGWLDLDGSGGWSPGDAVDLDADGLAGADEILTWLPAMAIPDDDRDTTRFHPGYDFLFVDANENGIRDYGAPDFTEQDLCYGERLFLADDRDGNGFLDRDESVVGLGTSKIKAVYSYRIYRRGENLIEFHTSDEYHGTPVCGIIAGGWPRLHRYSGIAPDADLLIVTRQWDDALLWAREEGADIVLYQYYREGTDGGSALDAQVNDIAEDGIIFVAAAGNGRRPRSHVTFVGDAPREFEAHDLDQGFSSDLRITFIWVGPHPPYLRVEDPSGVQVTMELKHGSADIEGWDIYLRILESWRGTQSCDVWIDDDPDRPAIGLWKFSFPEWTGVVHGFYENEGFEEENWWVEGDGKYSVTSPGTADSAITVAAYENDGIRDMAWFSGEGPRIDGRPVVDIAAPGVRVVAPTGDPSPMILVDHPERPQFTVFTGTSASTPVVAGAAAILKQAFPHMDSGLFRSLLRQGAAQDSLTTDPDRWGAGRLRIYDTLAAGLRHYADVKGPGRFAVRIAPNPSRGPARISWASTGADRAEVRVFSVNGRLVWETTVSPRGGRLETVEWDGRDRFGTRAAAGMYFAHVIEGSRTGTVRLVRVQ